MSAAPKVGPIAVPPNSLLSSLMNANFSAAGHGGGADHYGLAGSERKSGFVNPADGKNTNLIGMLAGGGGTGFYGGCH
jgi:hypothetical protein